MHDVHADIGQNCRDPIPVPEKVRRPLTEVQEFDLHVVSRAADRAEFDKKIKEKEMIYKRYRDEAESANMVLLHSLFIKFLLL